MNSHHGIVGIVLAAGSSSRYGEHNKLIHAQVDGRPLGLTSAHRIAGEVDQTIVVARADDEETLRLFRDDGFAVIACRRAHEGMGFSLAAGVAAAESATAWVIGLADMPYVKSTAIVAVVNALRDGASIAVPAYQGQRGHPVGFSQAWLSSLLSLEGDQGARKILQENHDSVTTIETNDAGVLNDIDRPADLK